MTASDLPLEELTAQIDAISMQMRETFTALSQTDVNRIPFEGSWTAAQLLRHVSKSTQGVSGIFLMDSSPTDRNPKQRIDEIKTLFLDFETKMKSPEEIKPEDIEYDKQVSLQKFDKAYASMLENASKGNLDETVKGLPLGDITKIELLHFVLYHTTRHQYQLEKITAALK